jgi:hypothetical protein
MTTEKKRELIKTYLSMLLNEGRKTGGTKTGKKQKRPKLLTDVVIFKDSPRLSGLAAAAKRVAREEQILLNFDPTGKKPN